MSTAKLLSIVIPISIAFGMLIILSASALITKKKNWVKASYACAMFMGLAIGWLIGVTAL